MVEDVSREGRHHKHVRLHLPFEKRDEFMTNVPKGLTVRLYAPQQLDPDHWVDPDEVNITIVANENEPDPQYRRHKEDIDRYLSTINSVDDRIKILTENVTEKEQPGLLKDWFIKNEVLLDHPGLDEGLDHLRDKAANVREIEVTKGQKDSMNLKNAKKTNKVGANDEEIYTVLQGEI